MASRPEYAIGIDLGTTNSAVSYLSLANSQASQVLQISQMEDSGRVTELPVLPSFLYRAPASEQWTAGHWARKQAAITPGRVVHSAKSWLCHHSADRTAQFLPWRSDELPIEERISPLQASMLLLGHLRSCWNTKFQKAADFNSQNITITVPASFDAAAQKLTLQAALDAGYPDSARLLEEPQAAFYHLLEKSNRHLAIKEGHVLVVDIGGGTTDLSLLEILPGEKQPKVKRIAVSDHLLLGGDNMDLALAHLIEPRLSKDGLAPAQWNTLVALCRDIKERCLGENPANVYPVTLAGRGSGLFAGTLKAEVRREEIEELILGGFYPECSATDRPNRTQAGLREWALPYAADSAITRYLAEFLAGRPRVNAMLFNGGSLYPLKLRHRLLQLVGRWQSGHIPQMLDNSEPDLAVARGAAYFGALVFRKEGRIESGAARSVYLEVLEPETKRRKLVCVLPSGAQPEEEMEVSNLRLELTLNRPVHFQPFSSTRREKDAVGDLVDSNEEEFVRLPRVITTAALSGYRIDAGQLPVHLISKTNELGLLSLACKSIDKRVKQTWPLEFDLRAPESEKQKEQLDSGIDIERIEAAEERLASTFAKQPNSRDKISPGQIFKQLEQTIGAPKSEWNGTLLRTLWSVLERAKNDRMKSIEHEETWLILAGYFLRPGYGISKDANRIDSLWRILSGPAAFPGKRIQIQRDILWRRVAGGLSTAQQLQLVETRAQNPSAEWVRMAGGFEKLSSAKKAELIQEFTQRASELANADKSCAPYLAALGSLLNRSPLHSGAEAVVPADLVSATYEKLSNFAWDSPALQEAVPLFLRAARCVENSNLNVPKSLRDQIIRKLEKSGVPDAKIDKLRRYFPLENSERNALLGEALPPGLSLAE